MKSQILLLLFLLLPFTATADISIQLAANSDGSHDTAYPSGNKPLGGGGGTLVTVLYRCDCRV